MFTQKVQILTIFPQKFNFGQFSTSESEKYGEIFLNIFVSQGINRSFGRTYVYFAKSFLLENSVSHAVSKLG